MPLSNDLPLDLRDSVHIILSLKVVLVTAFNGLPRFPFRFYFRKTNLIIPFFHDAK
jgi:hypothetical protein